MLTNKKRLRKQIQFLLAAVALAWLTGCTPAGPRALLRGKRLVEEGKYADAVAELKVATSLLSTNAQAWNYLGLAYHHAGEPANAIDAYQRALKLNHDLVVVHYNLGCLLLEQNKPETLEGARNELTAFTLHQGNSLDGWLKLGTAHLRLSELTAAETSFKEVLRLSPQNVEALNDLGTAQLQRKHPRDAAAYFNSALKLEPSYGPALLNLAVAEIFLNNRPLALQKYREYLATNPHAANWETVNAAAQQLDQELNPPARPVVVAISPNVIVNTVTNNGARVAAVPFNTNVSRPENVAVVPKPVFLPSPKPLVIEPAMKPEVVRLVEAPTIKVAENRGTTQRPAASVAPIDDGSVEPIDSVATPKPGKRGFFQKLNPKALFHREPKTAPITTPLPPVSPSLMAANPTVPVSTEPEAVSKIEVAPPPPRPVVVPRYPYLLPSKPVAGNRAEAERLLARGMAAQRDHRMKDAVALYRSATQADPGYFEAQSTLGSAALEAGDLSQSLRAFELALAINPDSFNARYNFGLALKKANYIQDAAQELERLLAIAPTGEAPAHLAVVHLTLANLYAEQFHHATPARTHYLKVLELDPHNSQATAIRYWLQNNS